MSQAEDWNEYQRRSDPDSSSPIKRYSLFQINAQEVLGTSQSSNDNANRPARGGKPSPKGINPKQMNSKTSVSMAQTARLRGDVLIIVQAILLPATCLITYTIATSMDHVETVFPYISDSGTWPPESCIFGFLLVLYAICTLMAAYGRWRMVRTYDHNVQCPRMNNGALGVGFTAALGVFLVATFQETSVLMVHLLGAFLAFCFANIYMWMQASISRRVTNIPGFVSLVIGIRYLLALITTISALLVPVFTIIAQARYDGNGSKSHEIGTGKWESYMDGYDMHVAASVFEWTLAVYASLFFLTFVREFRHLNFGMPVVKVNATQINNHVTDGSQENGGYEGSKTDHDPS